MTPAMISPSMHYQHHDGFPAGHPRAGTGAIRRTSCSTFFRVRRAKPPTARRPPPLIEQHVHGHAFSATSSCARVHIMNIRPSMNAYAPGTGRHGTIHERQCREQGWGLLPYLRSLLMSCLRNIIPQRSGAQITRNTHDGCRSARRRSAV